MVSGFLSPGVEKAAYPDDLRNDLETSGYKIDVNAKLGHKEDKTEFMEDAHETLDARFEAFKQYIREDDWDLFFGVFMTTDRVNHFLFGDYEGEHGGLDGGGDGTGDTEVYEPDGGLSADEVELFMEFYGKVDRYLGELREMLADDTTMMVASDHGFTTLNHEVHCNAWLEEQGWLEYETDDHDELDDIAHESTAYSLIPGRFYLNLEGREPDGSVPQAEYEETRAELKSMLESMTGPNGEPVADRVVTKEEAFRGAHDDIAPDLTVIPNHGFDLKAGFKGHDEVFDVGPRNGMHSFDNASLFIDDPDCPIEDVDLFDIGPTILDLMDIDYNRPEFDGRSLVQN
jgi:predicted AlkP superfamily phosphohydrolase/phosphomutase